MAINSPRATILIRNMPLETEKTTRLTEYITILIEGLDAKIRCMAVEEQLNQQWELMYATADGLKSQLQAVKTSEKKQKAKSVRMVSRLGSDIAQVVEKKELSTVQAKSLAQVVKRAALQTDKLDQERREVQRDLESFFTDSITRLKSI